MLRCSRDRQTFLHDRLSLAVYGSRCRSQHTQADTMRQHRTRNLFSCNGVSEHVLYPLTKPPAKSSPIKVLFTVPDGSHAAILLHTSLLDALLEGQGIEWHFLTPRPRYLHKALQEKCPRNSSLYVLDWPAEHLTFADRHLQYLKQELWRMRSLSDYHDVLYSRLRTIEPKRYWFHRPLAKLIGCVPGIGPLLERIEFFLPIEYWIRILRSLAPTVVVLGSAGLKLPEIPVARAAYRLRIPMYGIVPSWDNLTTKGPLARGIARLSAWSPLMAREATRFHDFRSDSIDITGPPSFDRHFRRWTEQDRTQFFRRLGLDVHRRLLTYTSVPASTCPHSAAYARLLATMVRDNVFQQPCQLLVRLHPQDRFDNYRALQQYSHVHVDMPGEYLRATSGNSAILDYAPTPWDMDKYSLTLACSDVVINLASTVTLEACAFDKPVINVAFHCSPNHKCDIVGYYDLPHYRPVTQSKAVRICYNEAELIRCINDYLSNRARDSEYRRQLYSLYDPFADGCASARLGRAIVCFVRHCSASRKIHCNVADKRGQ